MALPKYAKLEIERRFLVDAACLPDLTAAPFRRIEDLYLDGGRLRLRKITASATGALTLKLCKKYPGDDPLAGPITNLYLTEAEHAAFAILPGASLTKRRYAVDGFGVDVFEGPLVGLILAEVEADSREAALAVTAPAWAVREVTGEPFFTGGRLCRATAADLAAELQVSR